MLIFFEGLHSATEAHPVSRSMHLHIMHPHHLRIFLLLPFIGWIQQIQASNIYNYDVARNRGGVVFNASNDDSSLVWNTAAPSGTSAMSWNLTNMGTGVLTNTTVTKSNLVSSTGEASSVSITVSAVSGDGYSDQTPKDGIWTGYLTTTAANGSGPTITLEGFSAGQEVNLVLYTGNARWSGANGGDFTFGGTTKSYSESVASSSMPLTEGVTYVRFDGLLADSNGEIAGSFGAVSGQSAILAGMQIEVVPEPSAAALGSLALLALLRRRR